MKWMLLLMVMAVALVGCTNPKEPKEAVQGALEQSMEMKSYTFNASLVFDELILDVGADAGMVGDMLEGSTLQVSGAYQQDPMRMEMTANIHLQGDFSMNIEIPMIMAENKLWVKVPSIPMMPMPGISGQFIEVDLKKLSEEQGVEMPAMDLDSQRKMIQDITSVVMNHYDEESYFSEAEETELAAKPEGMKLDQIVKFTVNEGNFEEFVTILVEKVAPDVIDLLMNNEEYRTNLQLTTEQLEQAKQELEQQDGSELQAELNEIKENLKVNEISVSAAIKDGYMVYQEMKTNVNVTADGETATIGMFITGEYNNINDAVDFKLEIPTDAVPLEELMNMDSPAAMKIQPLK